MLVLEKNFIVIISKVDIIPAQIHMFKTESPPKEDYKRRCFIYHLPRFLPFFEIAFP